MKTVILFLFVTIGATRADLSSSLSDQEIETLVNEAKTHEGEDAEKRRAIESRNKLDGLIYSTEKLISENKEKIPEDEVAAIESVVAESKQALESGSPDEMDAAYEKLTQASHKVASVLYESAAQAGETPAHDTGSNDDPNAGPAGEDEVIDAEFVDVDAENNE